MEEEKNSNTEPGQDQEQEPTTDQDHHAPDAGDPDQQEQMDEFMSALDGKEQPSDEQPAEEPEQESQPDDAEVSQDAPLEEETQEKEQSKQEEQKQTEQQPDSDPLDTLYEVKSPDGVRQVPAKDLVTTYQQHKNLQRQHTEIKPVIDLAKTAGVPMQGIMPYLELGIKTAMAQQQQPGQQPNQQQTGQQPPGLQQPGEYQGPFASTEEDEQVKELDPTFHASMWNQYNQLSEMRNMVGSMQNEFQNLQRKKQMEEFNAVKADLEQRIENFAGNHTDYFSKDPNTGKSERMDRFKMFLAEEYGDLDITKMTPQKLSSAFYEFDPGYYDEYVKKQALKDMQKLKNQQRQTFAETDNVSTPSPGLTKQQQAMEGMLD